MIINPELEQKSKNYIYFIYHIRIWPEFIKHEYDSTPFCAYPY